MVQNSEPRRRGRPRAYDAEEALARAKDLFWEAGFAATSLDELAAATGMNRPSLYAAFGDKRALYAAALERQAALTLASVEAGLAVPGSLRETLRQFYRRAADVYLSGESRGCFLTGTALTEALGDPDVRRVLDETFSGIQAKFAGRLRASVAAGDLPKDADVEGLAFVAASAMHGLAIRARAGGAREALLGWADATADVLAGGLT